MSKEAFKFTKDDAINYDTYLGPFIFEPYARHMASRMDPAKAANVLEIAAGSGRVTMHLHQKMNKDAHLVASDISNDMLDIAREKLKGTSVEFVTANALELPFADNTFDYVFCQYGIMFFPDKAKGFSEAFRVLKPGGQFLFSTWDKTANMPVFNAIFNDTLLPFFKGEDTARLVVPFSIHEEPVILKFLNDAGFKNTTAENIRIEATASAADIVQALFLKHALRKEVEEKDPSAVMSLANEMEEKLDKLLKEDPSPKLSSWIGTGVKE